MLIQQLDQLRPELAQAAQVVYDSWEQNSDGHDEVYGCGGICDFIADRLIDVMYQRMNVSAETVGWVADHAFVHVWDDSDACVVDIPYSVYETGGGYKWTKIPGIVIQDDDVVIEALPYEYVQDVE